MDFSNLSGKKKMINSICHYNILPIFNVIYIYIYIYIYIHINM